MIQICSNSVVRSNCRIEIRFTHISGLRTISFIIVYFIVMFHSNKISNSWVVSYARLALYVNRSSIVISGRILALS